MRGRFQSRAALRVLSVGALSLIAAGSALAQETPAPRHRPSPETPYLFNPDWGGTLTPEFPAQALAAGLTHGRTVVDCAVQADGSVADCHVTQENPANLGLGDAALAAAQRARLARGGSDTPGLRVDFAALFVAPAPAVRIENARPVAIITAGPSPSAPAPPPPRPRLVTDPSWSRLPRPEFPEQARERGLTSGVAGLRCRVEPNGVVSSCAVVHESVAGVGFSVAALAAARGSRLSPRTVDSAPPGSEVLVWVAFERPQEAGQ